MEATIYMTCGCVRGMVLSMSVLLAQKLLGPPFTDVFWVVALDKSLVNDLKMENRKAGCGLFDEHSLSYTVLKLLSNQNLYKLNMNSERTGFAGIAG